MTATATFSDGTKKDITELATWSRNSDFGGSTGIISVSNIPGTKGLVTSLGTVGSDALDVSYGGKGDLIYVRVIPW